MPMADESSDDPEVLRRQLGASLLVHCQLKACHYKAGRETLLPGWPVTILTAPPFAPLTRDELDRLSLADLFSLIHEHLGRRYPGVMPPRFAALEGYTEVQA